MNPDQQCDMIQNLSRTWEKENSMGSYLKISKQELCV